MWDSIGSTVWARQTLLSDVFMLKPDKWFKIWFFLVNRVNHKDNKQFKRGSCFTTYSQIMEYTRASRDQVDKFMRWSKSCQMLTTRKTTRGMIVSLLKYAEYQDAIKSKSDTKSDLKAKQKRNRSDTINKNVKNEKNENNNKQPEVAGINDLLGIFKECNPAINFGNKTQRKACEELINLKGLDGAIKIVKFAISIQDEKYAPTATTPHQLWTNYTKLENYYKKQSKPLIQTL